MLLSKEFLLKWAKEQETAKALHAKVADIREKTYPEVLLTESKFEQGMEYKWVKEDGVLDRLMVNLYPTRYREKIDINWAKTGPSLLLTAALLPLGFGYVGMSYSRIPVWSTPKFRQAYDKFQKKIKEEPEVKKALDDIQETLQGYKDVMNDSEKKKNKLDRRTSASELRGQLKNLFRTVKPLIKKFSKEADEVKREIDRETKIANREMKKTNLATSIKKIPSNVGYPESAITTGAQTGITL